MIQIDTENIDEEKETKTEVPAYTSYKPDIEKIKQLKEGREFDNLVVIGNGGSITSFRAYYYAFIDETDVNVHIVTTMDPDYLERLDQATSKKDTLVMPISKSGQTVGVIESLLYFLDRDYDFLPVTSDNDGALRQIAEERDKEFVEHPDIGGRFTGAVETALTPVYFAGIDIEPIRKGAEKVYADPEKPYRAAKTLYRAENNGYNEILTPFYSTRLFGYYPLLVQLMHETVCKDKQGQTVYGDLAPEYQHHTNQRLFGGKKNVIPLFVNLSSHKHAEMRVPEDLKEVDIRDRKLGELGEGRDYESALKSEYEGVRQALEEHKMPYINLELDSLGLEEAGQLTAFLQLMAVRSAELREVNPFNQPDVETSKKLGLQNRFEKGDLE
jgi:glucose-6-phosphate isomerase